jgi:TPR repeat protein
LIYRLIVLLYLPMRTLLLFLTIGFVTACTGNVAQGNAEFMNAMALINSNVETEAMEGRAKLEQAAALGSPDAAITLGYYYLEGTHGFTEDAEKAFNLFEQAARTGHVNAQYNAGLAHMRGIGTPIDMKKAYEWFLKAAYQGDAGAQYNTAVMLVNGDGVIADPLAAYAWFTLSAEQGYGGAEEDRATARRLLNSEQMQDLEGVITEIREKIKKPLPPVHPEGAVNANAPL